VERDAFLERVREAAFTAVLPDPPAVPARLPEMGPVDLVASFRSNAQAVNAVVHGPMARHGVPRAVSGIAAGHDCSRFVAWDELPVSGVASTLTALGLERVDHVVPVEGRKRHQQGFETVSLGVTGAMAGLAESGSVVLTHGPGRPRMASLVPEVHVALLDVSRIARTISSWAAESPESAADTTNLVIVTGPSRTGDIEMELNLGVHGPRHVHIVMFR
jgi:L-lactate dehydrogenase complex protein LldG